MTVGRNITHSKRDSWKGAAVQKGLQHGSRGIAIVKAVIRKRLANILQAGKDLACAAVIFKVWKTATVL
jgi:hypothetical protein